MPLKRSVFVAKVNKDDLNLFNAMSSTFGLYSQNTFLGSFILVPAKTDASAVINIEITSKITIMRLFLMYRNDCRHLALFPYS